MRAMLSRGASIVVLVISVLGSSAQAEQKAEKDFARGHYRQGLAHYNLREFDKALVEFTESYRLSYDATLLFNIGQCQHKLGDDAAALHSYRAYLRAAKDVRNRAEVEARIAELERKLGQAVPGSDQGAVAAPVVPPAAGRAAEASGEPAGASSPGTSPPDTVPAAVGGESTTTAPASTAGAAVPERAPAGRALPVAPAPDAAVSMVRAEEPRRMLPAWRRGLLWGGAALGVAGIGASAAAALMAISKNDQANKYCGTDDGCTTQTGVDLRHEAVVRANVATVAFVAGGVGLALAAAALWWPARSGGGTDAQTAISVGLGPQAIAIGGRF